MEWTPKDTYIQIEGQNYIISGTADLERNGIEVGQVYRVEGNQCGLKSVEKKFRAAAEGALMDWMRVHTDLLLAGEIQGVENQIEATRSMIADQQARQEQLRQQVKHVQDSIDSQLACVINYHGDKPRGLPHRVVTIGQVDERIPPHGQAVGFPSLKFYETTREANCPGKGAPCHRKRNDSLSYSNSSLTVPPKPPSESFSLL